MEFYQFDGSLSKKEREQILSEFETPNEENWVVFEEEVDDVEVYYYVLLLNRCWKKSIVHQRNDHCPKVKSHTSKNEK